MTHVQKIIVLVTKRIYSREFPHCTVNSSAYRNGLEQKTLSHPSNLDVRSTTSGAKIRNNHTKGVTNGIPLAASKGSTSTVIKWNGEDIHTTTLASR